MTLSRSLDLLDIAIKLLEKIDLPLKDEIESLKEEHLYWTELYKEESD